MKEQIITRFRKHFSGTPRIFRAPGRVNLIGEHTDYNDGFVFPMAIEHATTAAIAPRRDRLLVIWSENMQEMITRSLDDSPQRLGHWSDYVTGMAVMLEQDGFQLWGADLYLESTVPLGSGLSSSAALEVSSGLALLSTVNGVLDKSALARLGQRAENQFVGMNCGIMDQFISIHGQKDHALFLDCRTLEYQQVPLPADRVRIVICNTMVKHELGASEYNHRRAECEEGVRIMSQELTGLRALRDVSSEQFYKFQHKLPDIVQKRCRHVITENERTLTSIAALQAGEIARFGQLMNASHHSLRQDYEVSCWELDTMVTIAQDLGALGARMTGGGFGGCTVNLVPNETIAEFCHQMRDRYAAATGLTPQIYVSSPSQGAHELD